jgi:protein gp37
MTLTKSKGNMYDFVTHTWNAVKGRCRRDCSYCYVKRWGELKPLRLDEKEFKNNLGEGNFIFVGSGTDMFADDVPKEWILKVLEYCRGFDKNRYLFQSKNPVRFVEFLMNLPFDSVLCVTLESNRDYGFSNAPKMIERVRAMSLIKSEDKHITVEPILDFDLEEFVDMLRVIEPSQINFGADSGRNGLPEPSKNKLLSLIRECRKFSKVHIKENLKRLTR